MEKEVSAFTVDQLQVRILPNRHEMGVEAAMLVASQIQTLQAQQPAVNIIFASAPSQNEFLQALSQDARIDWSRIRAFHMDEYIGLAPNAPQAFGKFLKDRLFDLVPIEQVYYLDGNTADSHQECERYAALLQKYPVDIVCLGIGENCHLAFNDPHVAFFEDKATVKVVELDTPCRQQQVNDQCFPSLELVPRHALTVTIPALMKARYVFGIVPGANKATAIKNTLEEDVQETYPSTILTQHPNALLFIDADSAGKLSKVSSFK
ncbi:glucosamine-6-phosphate deaminase [Dyadobacter tibetensis]|uniref:glucosamine-6-phosphate deaminase n=1 Tax=Dyadobacter tibetensis TaxID=1211851 RepID=UPI00046FEC6F|nr:glucosamine-6-phosphate deaminase [Dyadobacter tibetensis]